MGPSRYVTFSNEEENGVATGTTSKEVIEQQGKKADQQALVEALEGLWSAHIIHNSVPDESPILYAYDRLLLLLRGANVAR